MRPSDPNADDADWSCSGVSRPNESVKRVKCKQAGVQTVSGTGSASV